nr:proteoglycan 4-like [Setaria viridis]
MPQGSARGAPQEPVRGAPQESARSAPWRSSEPTPAVAPEPARGAPQESVRSASRRSTEPTPAVAQEPARGTPQESARSAPRRSTEPTPAVAPETQEQRSGDKRPLPDAPGSASGSEAKRACRPCSGGTAAPRGLVLQLAPKKALRVSSASAGRTAVPPAASGGVPGEVADPAAEAAPVTATGGVAAPSGAGEGVDPVPPSASLVYPSVQSIVPQGPQAREVIDLDADEAEGTAVTRAGTGVPAAATGSAAATEEGVPASAATAEEASVTQAGTSAPEALQDGFFRVILASELTLLREVLDTKRAEHGNLQDAVRVVCDGLSVVHEEETSSLATRVLGTYRRAHEIALEALHTGVRSVGKMASDP